MNNQDAEILVTIMQYSIQILVLYWFTYKIISICKGADSFVKWLKK